MKSLNFDSFSDEDYLLGFVIKSLLKPTFGDPGPGPIPPVFTPPTLSPSAATTPFPPIQPTVRPTQPPTQPTFIPTQIPNAQNPVTTRIQPENIDS